MTSIVVQSWIHNVQPYIMGHKAGENPADLHFRWLCSTAWIRENCHFHEFSDLAIEFLMIYRANGASGVHLCAGF